MCKLNVALGCLVLAAVAVIAGAAQANVITNGDFETGDATGWVTTGTYYVETGYQSPPEYNYLAVTNSAGSFTQQFSTVTAGLTYNMSYDLGGGSLGGGVAGLYYDNGTSWVPLIANAPTTGGSSDWYHFDLSFTAEDGQPYVGQPIAARMKPVSNWMCMDNVVVTITPEPGAIVMLGIGVIGLLCYAWKKRR
jgi:hypothetical protein